MFAHSRSTFTVFFSLFCASNLVSAIPKIEVAQVAHFKTSPGALYKLPWAIECTLSSNASANPAKIIYPQEALIAGIPYASESDHGQMSFYLSSRHTPAKTRSFSGNVEIKFFPPFSTQDDRPTGSSKEDLIYYTFTSYRTKLDDVGVFPFIPTDQANVP